MLAYLVVSMPRRAYSVAIARMLSALIVVASASFVNAGALDNVDTKQSDDSSPVMSPSLSGMLTGDIRIRPLTCHDSQCHGHGNCLDNACDCWPHWAGTYCSTFIVDDQAEECPDPTCSGHGRCDVGLCRCDAGWSGASCSVGAVCSDYCNSPGGTCQNGFCVCNRGWGGETCGERVCEHQCWGHGVCNHGTCICQAQWEGDECESRVGLPILGATPWEMPNLIPTIQQVAPGPGPVSAPGPAPVSAPVLGPPASQWQAPGPAPSQWQGWTLGSIFNFPPAASAPAPHPIPLGQVGNMTPPATLDFVPISPPAYNPNILLLEKERSSQRHPFVLTKQMFQNTLASADGRPSMPVPRAIDGEAVVASSALSGGSAVSHTDSSAWGNVATSAMHQVQSAMEAAQRALAAANVLQRAGAAEKMYLRKGPKTVEPSPTLHALPASNAIRSETQRAVLKPCGCDDECGGHGNCVNQQCSCVGGWSGEGCEFEPCPNNCNGRGTCSKGTCTCNIGFVGASCETMQCLNDCNNHGLCSAGQCICDAGWGGKSCGAEVVMKEPPSKGQQPVLKRAFHPGPPAATTPKPAAMSLGAPTAAPCGCIEDCSGHGSCENQVCSCTGGWSGEACDIEPCTNDCNGRGACLQGSCVCNAAFYGVSCEYSRCLNDCSGHGLCSSGKCICDSTWTGDSCSTEMQIQTPPPKTLPLQSKPTYLRDAMAGFMGETAKLCPENCNGNGKCAADSGTCDCFPGYSGVACQDFCPNLCSGQGKCTSGRCLCLAGFIGVDCSIKACCSGHGDCTIPGTCICNPGFIGDQCQMAMECPDPSCSGHGSCQSGQCACEAGFSGVTCSTAPAECGPCPPGGQCDRETGHCMCGGSPCQQKAQAAKGPGGPGGSKAGGLGGPGGLPGGFGGLGGPPGPGGKPADGGGKDPNTLPGAKDDLAKGGVKHGPGADDKTLNFHPNCNAPTAGKWNSSLELCQCNGDFYGDNCENQHCADFNETTGSPDCSGNGMCVKGKCFCAAGWGKAEGTTGVNVCKDPICSVDCGPHGMCKENMCICQDGWQGPACREPKCQNDCYGHGVCTFVLANSPAECQCDYGFTGGDCSAIALYQKLPQCPNACSGNGLCMNGKCVCSEGSSGPDCSGIVCPEGRSGPKCEHMSCPRDCMGYGLCFNGECSCYDDHSGPDCSIPMECYDACYEICLPDLLSPRCEFCKGQCLTALHGSSGGGGVATTGDDQAGPDCDIPMKCTCDDSCKKVCAPDLKSAKCDFCKGQCAAAASGNSIGKHNPMLARLYSLADLGSEQDAASRQNLTSAAPLPQSRRPLLNAGGSRSELPHQRIRRTHKEVSAVQTSGHLPRKHHEVSSVKVGSFRTR